MPRYKDDKIINSYEIMLKNLSKQTLTVELKIKDFEGYDLQYPKPLVVEPSATLKKKVFLFISAEKLEKMPILNLDMQSFGDDKDGKPLESELSFRRPLRRKK